MTVCPCALTGSGRPKVAAKNDCTPEMSAAVHLTPEHFDRRAHLGERVLGLFDLTPRDKPFSQELAELFVLQLRGRQLFFSEGDQLARVRLHLLGRLDERCTPARQLVGRRGPRLLAERGRAAARQQKG